MYENTYCKIRLLILCVLIGNQFIFILHLSKDLTNDNVKIAYSFHLWLILMPLTSKYFAKGKDFKGPLFSFREHSATDLLYVLAQQLYGNRWT